MVQSMPCHMDFITEEIYPAKINHFLHLFTEGTNMNLLLLFYYYGKICQYLLVNRLTVPPGLHLIYQDNQLIIRQERGNFASRLL